MEPGDAEHPDLEITPIESGRSRWSGATPLSRWLRSLPGRLTISALCCVLVLGALVATVSGATSNPTGAFSALLNIPTPTATQPVASDADAFFVTNSVPWGKLTIDGAIPTYSQILDLGPGFRLPRGVHHLEYQARLFPVVRCVISVPPSTRDTCPLADSAGSPGITFERTLDLQATPQRLQAADYQALFAAVLAQLNHLSATATIQPGERYYTQNGKLAIAHTPMRFTVGVSPSPTSVNNCLFLCTVRVGPASDPNVWHLQASVGPTWTITDASGAQTPSAIPAAPHDAIPLSLAITYGGDYGGGWKVQIEDFSPLQSVVAGAAANAFSLMLSAPTPINGFGSGGAANAAQGAYVICDAIQASDAVGANGVNSPAGPLMIFFWRFGVLLAVNPEAVKDFPKLPVATAYESQIAMAAAKQAIG